MKKTILPILLILIFGQSYAQTNIIELNDSTSLNIDSLIDEKLKKSNAEISSLKALLIKQEQNIKTTDSLRDLATEKAIDSLKNSLYVNFITHWESKEKIASVYDSINSVNEQIDNDISTLEKDQEDADSKIKKVSTSLEQSDSKISTLESSLSEKQKLGLGVTGFVILLIILVYFIIKQAREKDKKENDEKLDEIFEKQISDAKKLVEWLDELSQTNLHVSQEIKEEDMDHSFAKRIANGITTLSNTLYLMDENVKGYKHLNRSIKKLEISLKSNGYEMIEFLNKEFKETMNVSASFIPDDNLDEGVAIITRVLQPQINYNGKLIQAAEVQVSQG